MGCLDVLLKAILIITNVVVLVAGLAMLVLGGIYLNRDFDFYPELAEYSTNVSTILIPMMVLGGILLLVGLIGCIGACTGKAGLLNVYFVVVLIVVILEVALIIVCVVKKDDVRDVAVDAAGTLFGEYMDTYVYKNVTGDETISEEKALAVNTFMSVVGCCGLVDGPAYWEESFNTAGKVPPGCCADWAGETVDDKLVDCAAASLGEEYANGCTEEVDSMLAEFGIVIIVVVALVIVFELVCMCAACYSKKNDMVA